MAKQFEINIDFKTNTKSLEEASSLLKEITDSDNVDININADDTEVEEAIKNIDVITNENGEVIGINIDTDDSSLKSAKKEVDDMKGDKIPIDIPVDDSDIKKAEKEIDNLKKSLESNTSSMGNAITGIVSGLAGKSIWDTIYGTSAKAETNKVLIKNMGDTSEAYQKLYDTIDTTTDNSLISMQQLIPAMNGIKSATGATAKEIDSVTPGVANFGQYVYAMTGSSAKAEQAMFDLSKGIKGAYASLDQYGITEDALMRTGLWSGKEDDIEGYIQAVNQVTGSTDDLMNTATGMEALMGKSFSRAGKRIGESVLPAVKQLLQGFNDLDSATNGWLSTSILVGGSIGTSVVSGLSALNQAKQGYDALRDSVKTVKGAYDTFKTAVDTVRNAETLAMGIKTLLIGGETIEEGVQAGNTLAKTLAIAPTITLAGAEMSLLIPIILVAGAILILIGALWYLYNNNETVRKSIDGLIEVFQGFIGQVIELGSAIVTAIMPVIEQIIGRISMIIDIITMLIQGNISLEQAVMMIWGIIQNTIQTATQVMLGAILNFGSLLYSYISNAFHRALSVIISIATSWITNTTSKARQLVNSVYSTLSSLPSKASSAMSGIAGILTRPFTSAYNQVKPIIDKFQQAVQWGKQLLGWGDSGADFGFNGVSFSGGSDYGFDGADYSVKESLNSSLTNMAQSNSNSATIINNWSINGIIEEEASEFIVESVNSYIKKQNLIRGV